MMPRPSLSGVLAAVLILIAGAASAQAGSLRLLGDWTYSVFDSRVETRQTGVHSDNDSRRFNQRYRLDIDKDLYPTLRLNGGAQMEKNEMDNTTDDVNTKFTTTAVRPYVEVEMRTPLYSLAGGYRENMVKDQATNLPTTREFTKTTTARGEWRPTRLPSLEGNYTLTNRHDQPLTRNIDTEILRLVSRYEYREFDFLYSYLRNDEERTLEHSRTVNNGHNGRVRYFRGFLRDTLAINAGLRVEHTDLKFSGSSNRFVPTVSIGSAFYLLDDSDPAINLAGEFTPVTQDTPLTNVNIGLGGGIVPVSFGLSFGERVPTDMLRIRALEDPANPALATPAQIATVAPAFIWRVFVSADQETWIEKTVTSVSFDQIDNQFEIRFSPVADNEFIKVVTIPLNLTPVGKILIRDIQAFVTVTTARGNTFASDYYNATFGLGWEASNKTTVIYDFSWQQRKTDLLADRRTRLNNGLNVIHRFSRIYSGTTRLQVTDIWEHGDHDSTLITYGAQMAARYLDTLNQTLTYSGGYSIEPEGDTINNSLILRTNAEVYRGWNMSFDQGYSKQNKENGPETSDFFLRLQNSIVPHRRLTLIADYAMRWNWESGGSTSRSQSGRFRTTWVPTDSLSLVGEVRVRKSEDDASTYWEYGVNWMPFRDGTLQFNLSYFETGTTEEDLARNLSPSLIWEMTDYATLTLTYTRGKQESKSEIIDYDTALANFRILFD